MDGTYLPPAAPPEAAPYDATGRMVPVESDVGEVKAVYNRLTSAITDAHHEIGKLEERIEPILSTGPVPSGDKLAEPRVEKCEFASALDAEVVKLQHLVDRIREARARVQL